ncbi:exodeoxyribonuclease VII small subunit [Arthrobacter globiformis NBRC 12137]|jgi:exodeoxyribonuclease VII small subunit|uniref:Exodeoxyribonuclease 7 small subunit n=1 Tax=Arthrobacter globiformis (strain ATCC 8010 / DSM 20124 / JCM 1332 / NBRC 12137 / NCIMB 8907 / NRRL B-2979 / 168) TaxID=1077972 RepID=H0QR96_ARTG1|nr:exodeoxyribonuclease VII small subunit [Arthrobacter globiformis NBRC 12137]
MTDPTISTEPENSTEPANSTAQPGTALPPDIDALSYEEAREQLVAVVSKLEAGGTSLEDSLALWERGEALARRCEEWLEGARKRLAAARKDS